MDNKKIKKNLYLPSWIVESLDKEAKIAGGAGVVAGAAIYHFCSINKKERAEILEKYHKRDIATSYGITAKNIVDKASKARRTGKLSPASKLRKPRG